MAGAEVRGFVVVGRADDGRGRWVVGFALADTFVVGTLGVGSGVAVGWGAAVDDGTTSVGPPLESEPPRKTEVTRAPPPQQSTSRPSTGSSMTASRRRSAGCAGTSAAGCSHGIPGSVGVVTGTPCDQTATLVEGCVPCFFRFAGALRGKPDDGVGRHWWRSLTADDFRASQLLAEVSALTRPEGW